MKTDYKFWYISRNDNIHISECAVRFYEGEVTTLPEMGVDGTKMVTRYRRSKKLSKSDMPHNKDRAVKLESAGSETLIYTTEDFGVISTDDELRLFLNGELAKDTKRSPIEEQTGNTLK